MERREWDMFTEMSRARRSSAGLTGWTPGGADEWTPPVDIYDREDALVMLVDLPGLKREEIGLEVDSDGLTLQGDRAVGEQQRRLRAERPAGRFRRSFRIGMRIDPAQVRATYREGVLEIVIPKAEPSKPARLRIDVE
jgi:HSP20 family protein